MYLRVWEYEVGAEHTEAFLAAYGPEGDWAQLFRRGRGFVGTELYRRTDDEAHFVTVDRWTDQAAWRAFLQEWGSTYQALDRTMAGLTKEQAMVLEGP